MHQLVVGVARLAVSVGMLAAILRWRKLPTGAQVRQGGLDYIPEPEHYPPLSAGTLLVETERFLDTDQETEDGPCTYYYSGMYFTFTHGSRVAQGRYYDDDPHEFNIYLRPPEELAADVRYPEPPYRDPVLREVVEYLRRHEPQRSQLQMLCKGGYVPIEQDRIAGLGTQ